MNLTLYFRLILTSIFQSQVVYDKKDSFREQPMSYDNQLFYCPTVYAIDGFNVSLQIHNSNYCSSENGYREFGHTMKSVEFGFPSHADELLAEYAEEPDKLTETVGMIPVTVLEELFTKHGGIDWEKTISVEMFNKLTKHQSAMAN